MITDVDELAARLYDLWVEDWPGELDFYRGLAAPLLKSGGELLEIACGTGRVTIPLAHMGLRVVGMDISDPMLEVARSKSEHLPNLSWVLADMRDLDLGRRFELIIGPGHVFQHLVTPADQFRCLTRIYQHLEPGGQLVLHLDHQDLQWLGELPAPPECEFDPAEELRDPLTGYLIRMSRGWAFERTSQTAMLTTIWDALDEEGAPAGRWQRGPIPLHCAFRFEMEHLLARAGFELKAIYGDFHHGELGRESDQMIFLACKPAVG